MNEQIRRKVGWKLGTGIFLLPIVFAWFLIRPGYSMVARSLGFGWMTLVIIGAVASPRDQPAAIEISAPTTAPPAKPVPKKSNSRRVAEARAAVRDRLKDPRSAQFGDAVVSDRAVCGSVNAKNGFGGYSGQTPFIVIGTVAFMPDDAPEKWAEMWAEACTN